MTSRLCWLCLHPHFFVAQRATCKNQTTDIPASRMAAAARADVLERAIAGEAGGCEGGGSGVAGPSEASAAADVPDEYICPITAEIMTDPVTTLDGFTYERAAITEWLRTKDTSPKTGATLESKMLIPNHLVRGMIRAFNEGGSAFS